MMWAVWYGLEGEAMKLDQLRRGDWVGIVCMAIGLGSLITVLEEGERTEWFGDPMIQHLSILAAIFIPAFIAIELWHKEPFINLRLLLRRGFASVSFMGFVLGLVLYGSIYIIPVYLAQIRGYDAMQIGEVVMWIGLPQLAIFPLVPFVMRRVDPRLMVAFGTVMFAISCFMNSFLTHDWGIQQFRWSQLVRAAGQPFMITPLSALSAGALPQHEQANGSAIFNIMRNLGGSVGIAMLSFFLTEREHYHFSIIGNHLTLSSLKLAERIQELTAVADTEGCRGRSGPHPGHRRDRQYGADRSVCDGLFRLLFCDGNRVDCCRPGTFPGAKGADRRGCPTIMAPSTGLTSLSARHSSR